MIDWVMVGRAGIFIISSIIICIQDIRTMHVPLVVLWAGFCAVLILTGIFDFDGLLWGALGAAGTGLLFVLTRFLTWGKLGWGDVQYSVFCGFITGFPACFSFVICACVLAAAGFIITKKKKKVYEKKMAFTPFMFLGCLPVIILLFF